MTLGPASLNGWSEKLQSQPTPKCLVTGIWCWSDSLQLLNTHKILTPENHTQQIKEMHQKLHHPQLVRIS